MLVEFQKEYKSGLILNFVVIVEDDGENIVIDIECVERGDDLSIEIDMVLDKNYVYGLDEFWTALEESKEPYVEYEL